MDGLPERLAATMDKAKPQNVANVLWGIARSGPPLNSELVRFAQTHMETSPRAYLPVDLSSVLWALGTMTNRGDYPGGLDGLVLATYTKMKSQMTAEWSARHISSATWGIATLATNGFAEPFKNRADVSRANTLSLSAWSISALRFKDEELLKVAIESMNADAAANYADFTAAVHAAAITQSALMPPSVVDELWGKCGVMNAPDTQLAICGWSLTALDLGRGLYTDKVNMVADRLSVADLTNLNQAARKLARTVLSASNRVINLPRERLDLRSSQAHQNWVGALRKYGVHGVQSEFEVIPGVFVDIALPADKVAIEVQGDSHYLTDLATGQRIDTTGNTKLKRQMVERRNWTLLEVPVMRHMPSKRDVEKFLKPFLM
ncbi:hypothetical protein FOZ62_024356 [Perkinsus olseni]|uniref:RAP domain-containing protein n=1 Tax=Perkinsus olseni TaxID=32597 RepID=A0A7J6PQ17_PEROL|nr:hypothetical protein FOZ62_024356 [Perkinsus olseni]